MIPIKEIYCVNLSMQFGDDDGMYAKTAIIEWSCYFEKIPV